MPKPNDVPDLDSKQKFLIHGFGMSSPVFWADLVGYRWSLIVENWATMRKTLDECKADGAPIPEIGGLDARHYYPLRMNFEAVSLIQGARHVLRYRELYIQYSGCAKDAFNLDDPRYAPLRGIAKVRDTIEHFDEYSIGEGRRPHPPMSGGYVEFSTGLGTATFVVGDHRVHLPPAVNAVQTLARELERLWHLSL